MQFQCANCKHVLRADNETAGRAAACDECGCVVAVPPHRFAPGVVIGDFRIISKIGEGAIGTVYYAHQLSLDRPAALKVLRSQFAEDVNYRERFLQEARTAAKLNHPGIVQAYAVGEEEGDYYFAMEHVQGSTLKKVLAHSGNVMTPRAVAIVKQICEALDFAWTNAKLVHRDIKPDNIILTEDGQAKLADLGLAKIGGDFLNEDSENVFGTPQYIAPEQLMGEAVDCRTDIYSLGATFYQLVTGRYPYTGTDPGDISRKHLYETLTPPNKLVPEIAESLSLLIQIMMAKRAENRYQTPQELLEDLNNVEKGRPLNRELPADSQQLFSPDEVAADAGGEEQSGTANAAGESGQTGKRRLKLNRSRRSAAGSGAASSTSATAKETGAQRGGEAGKGGATTKRGGRASRTLRTQGRGAGKKLSKPTGSETSAHSGPFESDGETAVKRGKKRKGVAALIVLLVAAAAGGAYWYHSYSSQNTAGAGGGQGDPSQGEALLAEVRSLMADREEAKAMRAVQAYAQKDRRDPAVMTELRQLVAPALEARIRALRQPRIRELREDLEEQAETLIEAERLRKEREREQQEAEQLRREREQELQRQKERREQRLAELKRQQEQIRRTVVENCRKRDYSKARFAPLAMQNVDEKEFAEWAEKMVEMVQLASTCFETVSGSGELLKGLPCQPTNWGDLDNLIRLEVNYIGSRNVILSYTRKVYENGVYDRNESGVSNVKFETVRPAAMARLFSAAWQRSDKGSRSQRDLLLAAYLICEARALDEAQNRLGGLSDPRIPFLEQELQAVRELGI